MQKAVDNVAKLVDESELHLAVVECDTEECFCEEAFSMTDTPMLILIAHGPWSVGTSFVWTLPPAQWKGDDPYNVEYVRSFALGNYKLKIREYHPYRLLFNPASPLSRLLAGPNALLMHLQFAQLGDLWDLRKNAVAVIVLAGSAVGVLLERTLLRRLYCCCA